MDGPKWHLAQVAFAQVACGLRSIGLSGRKPRHKELDHQSTLETMKRRTAFVCLGVRLLCWKLPSARKFCPRCTASVDARLNSGCSLIRSCSHGACDDRFRAIKVARARLEVACWSHPVPDLALGNPSVLTRFVCDLALALISGREHLCAIFLRKCQKSTF